MSTGTWVPADQQSTIDISSEWLMQCIERSHNGWTDNLAEHLSEAEIRDYAPCMRSAPELWQDALNAMDEDGLLTLMRYFTLAEQQLPGWEAGKQSPVITIHRHFRKRGFKLPKEVLQWIKANSDNRFLPYGEL